MTKISPRPYTNDLQKANVQGVIEAKGKFCTQKKRLLLRCSIHTLQSHKSLGSHFS